jgi:5-methylcytosine-specific restriction protein B
LSPRDNKWDLVAVVGSSSSDIATKLRKHFPNAQLIEPVVSVPGGDVVPPAGGKAPTSTADLAESLFLDQEWVDEVLWMLHDRRAVVLYGPPGTGKTFIARHLASHIQPDETHRGLVQLHPSYAYEDFFEGYRPIVVAGKASLDLRWGPLRHLAKLARDNPNQPVVLILDEMNRGNLPRVFGELFFLLEYRDQAMKLMYSPEETFQLPRNLYFIGTMNTADRSIAMLDQALRRRFHFAGLFPDAPPVSGMLRRYLTEHRPDMMWVATLLDEVNRRIGDRNVAVGPSHFMRSDLDEVTLGRVWRASVLPTIEEHFYGRPERIAEFALDRLTSVAKAPGVDAG